MVGGGDRPATPAGAAATVGGRTLGRGVAAKEGSVIGMASRPEWVNGQGARKPLRKGPPGRFALCRRVAQSWDSIHSCTSL